MKAMPMVSHQPLTVVGPEGFKGCSGCHKMGEKSAEELKSPEFRYGTGSCDSCHTRHSFSVNESRNPRACSTCHMGFDHPQWEMWETSKHGTIWLIEEDTGRAPKCQTERTKTEAICRNCHSAGYVTEQMAASDKIVRETDSMMAEGIRTVKGLYADGLLKKPDDWKYAPDMLQFY